MPQKVENQAQMGEQVRALLAERPEGMSVLDLAKELNSDTRQVKLALTGLQSANQVSSGLRKLENKYTFFERYYFPASP